MKRTPLRRMSKEKAVEHRKYLDRKKELFFSDRFCEFPDRNCHNRAVQIHHMRGRTGPLLNDERYWLLVCQTHHKWIHDNAKEAREMGLLK